MTVTRHLLLPTRRHRPGRSQTPAYLALHHPEFSLFTTAELYLVSVPLVVTSRCAGVTRRVALWCPDFPPAGRRATKQPASFTLQKYAICPALSNFPDAGLKSYLCRDQENGMNVKTLVFILLHVLLGWAVYRFPVLAKVYATALTVAVFILIFIWKKIDYLIFLAGYVMAAEVFTRMTRGLFFYEIHKYLSILIFLAILFHRGIRKSSVPYMIYILLLLPGIFYTMMIESADPSYIITSVRKTLFFNIAGPMALGIGAIALDKYQFGLNRFKQLFQWMIYPIITTTVYVIFHTPSLKEVFFTTSANFATSGGFGPNQVATILGLGIFLAAALFVLSDNLTEKIVWLIFLVLVSYRSFLTFSRGGTLTGIAMVIVFVVASMRSDFRFLKSRNIIGFIAASAVVVISFNLVMEATQGIIWYRFTGKNRLGQEKPDYTSGRKDLFLIELEDFIRHPVMGAGVGRASLARYKRLGIKIATHAEISRLLSEHGIFGLTALLLLMLTPFLQGMASRNNIFFWPFYVFWLFTISHSAMRLVAPATMYAFSLILLKKNED